MKMRDKLLERFLRYIAIDTGSNPETSEYPSSEGQKELGQILVKELNEIGCENVIMDAYGYVTAEIPSNTELVCPVVGFFAHLDTSPDLPGQVTKPLVIQNYDGKDVVLNSEKEIILRVSEYPELQNYIGQSIITGDGTTLLGADNKAGIAEIITAVEFIIQHPEINHGTVKIAFTCDEETGRGVDFFDTEKFGAELAYTIDGGRVGELEYENFNAALAEITINGINIHPGEAKNRMLNSMELFHEFHALLPAYEKPEHTEGTQGFFHLTEMQGTVEKTSFRYIIRDHNRNRFEERKSKLTEIAEYLNARYKKEFVFVKLQDQYYNMREIIEKFPHIIDYAIQAYKKAGITPEIKPVRGGTDGARLTFKGLPCPNIFTGGHNFHSRYEFIPLESMEKATQVIINLIQQITQKQ